MEFERIFAELLGDIIVRLSTFHVTPGWVGVGTVSVGILAIVASSVASYHTLNRSSQTLRLAEQNYARTEDRFRMERIEAHKDRVRDSVLDATHRIRLWRQVAQRRELFFREAAKALTSEPSAGAALSAESEALTTAGLEALRTLERATVIAQDLPLLQCQLDAVATAMVAATRLTSGGGQQAADITPEGLSRLADDLETQLKAVSDATSKLSKLASVVLKPGLPH